MKNNKLRHNFIEETITEEPKPTIEPSYITKSKVSTRRIATLILMWSYLSWMVYLIFTS